MVNRVNQDQAHPSTLGKMMGAKVASERWYRRPRKRRASGRAAGSQRTFIVPAKPGNLPHRDPVEGREVSGTWNPGGQDDGHIEVRENENSEHLNETPADSDAGASRFPRLLLAGIPLARGCVPALAAHSEPMIPRSRMR